MNYRTLQENMDGKPTALLKDHSQTKLRCRSSLVQCDPPRIGDSLHVLCPRLDRCGSPCHLSKVAAPPTHQPPHVDPKQTPLFNPQLGHPTAGARNTPPTFDSCEEKWQMSSHIDGMWWLRVWLWSNHWGSLQWILKIMKVSSSLGKMNQGHVTLHVRMKRPMLRVSKDESERDRNRFRNFRKKHVT